MTEKIKKWNPLDMQTIKQEAGSKDCMACCAAMLTDTTVEDFKNFCKTNELYLYDDFSFISYIRLHHFGVGFFLEPGQIIGKKTAFYFLRGFCYLVVESDNEWVRKQGASHSVLWDTEKIRDPNPAVKGHGKLLEEYNIKAILPLCFYENDPESEGVMPFVRP